MMSEQVPEFGMGLAAVIEPAEEKRPGRRESVPVDLTPRCMVCSGVMPPTRARNSDLTTCSPECQKVMRNFRKHQRWLRSCPSCLHPSTPEQREDFKRWRTERGSRRGDKGDGRPRKREATLAELLADAKEWLAELRCDEFSSNSDSEGVVQDYEMAGRIRELDTLLQKIGKVLDVPAPM